MSQAQAYKLTDEQIEERAKLLESWIDDLRYIRNLATGKLRNDLQGALGFAETFGRLAIPTTTIDGKWGLTRWMADDREPFFLAPLLLPDAEQHTFFENAIRHPVYFEGPKTIFLPPEPISRKWRGILLLHEMHHVISHRSKWHRRKKLGHWAEEYEVYKDEALIVRKLYGKKYSEKVYRLSKKFEPDIRAHHLAIKDTKLIPNTVIEQIFGKPLSPMESGTQRGVLILDAAYRAIDRIYKPGRTRDRCHQTITFWFCDPKGYAKYREAEKQRKADKTKTKSAISKPDTVN